MGNYSGWSDRELFEAPPLDSGKVAELISRYINAVFSAAKSFSSGADLEELISDGMEGLLSAIQNYDNSKGEFAAYASVCIKNRMRNTLRKSIRRNSELLDAGLDELTDIRDPAPTPEELVIEQESSRSMLENLRGMLTDIELHCIEGVAMGLSYEELADQLGVDKKSVDNALCRARAKLKERFFP